jgi:predicted transcriptional regulator
MGKMKEHPRYNVLSVRVSDETMEALEQARPVGVSRSALISQAVEEYLDRRYEKTFRDEVQHRLYAAG